MFCKLREAVDLVINDNKTEQILLDESCFDEAKITELNNWKIYILYTSSKLKGPS